MVISSSQELSVLLSRTIGIKYCRNIGYPFHDLTSPLCLHKHRVSRHTAQNSFFTYPTYCGNLHNRRFYDPTVQVPINLFPIKHQGFWKCSEHCRVDEGCANRLHFSGTSLFFSEGHLVRTTTSEESFANAMFTGLHFTYVFRLVAHD